jgi:hypothetical protein
MDNDSNLARMFLSSRRQRICTISSVILLRKRRLILPAPEITFVQFVSAGKCLVEEIFRNWEGEVVEVDNAGRERREAWNTA